MIRSHTGPSTAARSRRQRVEKVENSRTSVAGAQRLLCAWLLAAAIATAPGSALADDPGGHDLAAEAGIGAGAALATLVYGPVKLAYALGGSVVGGLAFLFSGGDVEVAKTILTPSLRGHYVVTPSQLQGKRDIEFFGRDPNYRTDDPWNTPPEPADVASAPEASGNPEW